MSYELDGTSREAREAAENLRQRVIPWEEQEAFFLRHIDECGELADLCLVRAMLGAKTYVDNSFWTPHDLLQQMFEEEVADAIIYHIIIKYRHELMGEYAVELGDVIDAEWWDEEE